jgi:hypothetical protein
MEKDFQNLAQKSGLPVAFARHGQSIAL